MCTISKMFAALSVLVALSAGPCPQAWAQERTWFVPTTRDTRDSAGPGAEFYGGPPRHHYYSLPAHTYADPSLYQYGPAFRYGPPPVLVPIRPASCGQYRYWDGERCADARYEPPYLGPRW